MKICIKKSFFLAIGEEERCRDTNVQVTCDKIVDSSQLYS